MEILNARVLHGPNVWSKVPVLEASVTLGPEPPYSGPDVFEACRRRLSEWLPGLTNSTARGPGENDDSPCRRRAATVLDVALHLQNLSIELAETLLNVTLPSQAQSREPLTLGLVGRLESPGICTVAVACEEERLGRACLEAACRFCEAALTGAGHDVQAELRGLSILAEDVSLGNVSAALWAAARAREIPICRLDQESLMQLGWGAQQQRIRKSFTSRTNKISEWIACNKEFTKNLLRELGLPVPTGRLAVDAEDAWDAACEIGLPVVVKPVGSDNTYGVSLKLTTRERVLGAYTAAREYGEQVIVERFVTGEQYRILVIGGRVVAANRREPPRVIGDGQRSISELIALANRDPRRGDGNDKHTWWFISCADDTPELLAEQGFELDSIPPAGLEVLLGRFGHLTAGARVLDVTDSVHPQVAAQCISAVRLLGLDVAGLDVIARDISRPLDDQGGMILEVNPEPWLVFHILPPFCDPPRPVCEAMIEMLFPAGQTGRIPLTAITGCGDNAAASRWLAQLLQGSGQRIGRASAEGLFLDDRRLKPGDQANRAGGRALLLCPEVEIAILERTLPSIRWEGLDWDRCDVAVVTDLSRQESGSHRPDSDPELVEAARVMVEAALPHGAVVLDVADPAAAALAAANPEAVILVSASGDHRLLAAVRRSVTLRGGDLVFAERDEATQLIPVEQHLAGWRERGQVNALLSAVAAAWAMQVPIEALRERVYALNPDCAWSTHSPDA